jgi:predicted RNase H-like HicB family nuclease
LKVEIDEYGVFVGAVPEHPGCARRGTTEKVFLSTMEEAILLSLETRGAGPELPRVLWVEKAPA